MDLLTINNLSSGYGKALVLSDINLSIKKGEIFGVVGPNGSGKSTLLKTIFGLTSIYDGTVNFNGTNITDLKPHDIAKLGLAYIPQVGNSFSNLKVRENLVISAITIPKEEKEERIATVLEAFPVVQQSLDRKTGTLSGGERQMLAMAMGLMRQPVLMMLDEPAGNLAPKIATQVFEKISELKKLGMTIILVEQVVKTCLELSDEVALLVSGKILFNGKSQKLLEDKEMSKLYLGVGTTRILKDVEIEG
jgi:branched-chain amino acid transport system ATP-binding protein